MHGDYMAVDVFIMVYEADGGEKVRTQKKKALCKDLSQTKKQVFDLNSSEITIIHV